MLVTQELAGAEVGDPRHHSSGVEPLGRAAAVAEDLPARHRLRFASTATTIAWSPNRAAHLGDELGACGSRRCSPRSCRRRPRAAARRRRPCAHRRRRSAARTPGRRCARRRRRSVERPSGDAEMSRKQISSAPCASYAAACSTGSPASRSSTKLMPLTTRPSLTSRHGMIRRASISATVRDRLARRVNALVVERAADDDRGDAGVAQRAQIVERADAARRDHLARDARARAPRSPRRSGRRAGRRARRRCRAAPRRPSRAARWPSSTAVTPPLAVQPSTATTPSRASTATITRPGCARHASSTSAGERDRRRAEHDVRRARARAPPRSPRDRGCRRRPRPGSATRATIARSARAGCGAPANAPSRSTTCRRSAPPRASSATSSTGRSWNTVTRSRRPSSRRTAWPPSRSIAGNSFTRPPTKFAQQAQPDAWLFSGWNWHANRLSLRIAAQNAHAVRRLERDDRRVRAASRGTSARSRRTHRRRSRRAADRRGAARPGSSPCAGS